MAASNGNTTALVIDVPQGGQVIRTFNLTPSQPANGKAGDWLWVDSATPGTALAKVNVKFNVKSSALEQEFERAVLVINLQQNPEESGYWRFAMNGVAINPKFKDVYHNVDFEVVDDGETLIAYVQVIGMTQEDIQFGFVASYTDAVSGAVAIYESADPGIQPGRP
ncbi:MAG TPA: DP-EP family protein [Cellvibrio sp.]|nr:DP-EP family protein [Cellvibrio sp.]